MSVSNKTFRRVPMMEPSRRADNQPMLLTGPVPVRLLDTTRSRRRLSSSLGSELFSRGFTTGGFSCGLLLGREKKEKKRKRRVRKG